MTRPSRRFWILILLPAALVAVGTLGYPVIEEKYDHFDAFYMTILTLTTIGYGEIPHELSRPGRWFTVVLILFGVFGFAYSASEIIRSVVGGELAGYLGKQKMQRTLANMHDHIIVCGFGRMGRLVCKEISRLHRPFVVIDRTEAEFKDFRLQHGVPLVGDATSDDILKQAGIERAHSLVTVMDSDAANLFTTMSAHILVPKLPIVARVEEEQSVQKFKRAGGDSCRIVSPYEIGGARVAHAVLKPTVVEFIELTLGTEYLELQMEEAKVEANSPLVGQNLRDSRLRAENQAIIVAIKKKLGQMLFNPPSETVLEAGDILVAMGNRAQLASLNARAHPQT